MTTATAPISAPEFTLQQFRDTAAAIEAEVGKVIVGQDPLLERMVVALLARGHILGREQRRRPGGQRTGRQQQAAQQLPHGSVSAVVNDRAA